MAGLVPAIRALLVPKTWMPGTRPGMTMERQCQLRLIPLVGQHRQRMEFDAFLVQLLRLFG
jgi:hypothetical protein